MSVPDYAQPGKITVRAKCLGQDCSWDTGTRDAWSAGMDDPDVSNVREEAITHGNTEGHAVDVEIIRVQCWHFVPGSMRHAYRGVRLHEQ